jgi:hypothetical protein
MQPSVDNNVLPTAVHRPRGACQQPLAAPVALAGCGPREPGDLDSRYHSRAHRYHGEPVGRLHHPAKRRPRRADRRARGHPRRPLGRTRPDGLPGGPHTLRPTATVTGYQPTGGHQLVGMTAGGGAVWATVSGAGVLRIDPASARVTARIRVATEEPPAAGTDAVWVVCCGGDTAGSAGRLVRIDPATSRVVATIPLHGLPDAVGAGPSGVWVRGALGPVWRIDPATNRVAATIKIPGGLGAAAGRILVGRDGVWVSDPKHLTVYQTDPSATGSSASASRPPELI